MQLIKLPTLLLISSLIFLSGCIGPKVNTCLFDMNLFDAAIDQADLPTTKEELKKFVRAVKPNYCVPPDSKDITKDFTRSLETGDHNYSPEDWGILMRWIEDHKK